MGGITRVVAGATVFAGAGGGGVGGRGVLLPAITVDVGERGGDGGTGRGEGLDGVGTGAPDEAVVRLTL